MTRPHGAHFAAVRCVVCTDNEGYEASLERFKVYRVLSDPAAARHGQIRIVDESGEDYLYARERFAPIAVPTTVRRALAAV